MNSQCGNKKKTIDVFRCIHQNKKETLQEYIDRFTKVAVAVDISQDGLNCWIFKKRLRAYYMFNEK